MTQTELLQKLIELVSNAAPTLWAIARRQAVVEGVKDIVGILMLLALAYIPFYISFYRLQTYRDWQDKKPSRLAVSEESAGYIRAMVTVFAIALTLFVIFVFSDMLNYFFNPDMQAIKILIDLVKP